MSDQSIKGGGFGTVERGIIDGQAVCVKRPLEAQVIDWDYYGEPVYAEESELDALFEQERKGNGLVQQLGKQDYLMEVLEVAPNRILSKWVEGCTLDEYIKEARKRGEIPSFEERKTLLAEILYGLRTLHIHGLSHHDLSAANIMIRKGTREPVLIDYSMVSPRGAVDIEMQSDLNTSYSGRGFRFIATMVLNWVPWGNVSTVHRNCRSIAQLNHFSGDPTPPDFDDKEQALLRKLAGPDNVEEPTYPTSFEEIEDLLI